MKISTEILIVCLILLVSGLVIHNFGTLQYHEITGSIIFLGAVISYGLSVVLRFFEAKDKK